MFLFYYISLHEQDSGLDADRRNAEGKYTAQGRGHQDQERT